MAKNTRNQRTDTLDEIRIQRKGGAPLTGEHLPFGRENYIWMVAGFALILIGFFLMSGTENIYSFTKITLGVLVSMAGFILEIFAILRLPKDNDINEAG